MYICFCLFRICIILTRLHMFLQDMSCCVITRILLVCRLLRAVECGARHRAAECHTRVQVVCDSHQCHSCQSVSPCALRRFAFSSHSTHHGRRLVHLQFYTHFMFKPGLHKSGPQLQRPSSLSGQGLIHSRAIFDSTNERRSRLLSHSYRRRCASLASTCGS